MGRSKKKSTIEAPFELNNEKYFNLEIDMQAIKGKNRELVETVARIQKEKGQLQKQLNLLQKEYFALNSKYVNLKNIFTTVDSTAKSCFPKVAEVVNQLAKIMRVCSVGAAISNTGDLKTQAVTPHRVNGTVIKSPTITIARFSDSPTMLSAMARSPRLSNGGSLSSHTSGFSQNARSVSTNNNHETEPRPSTSRGFSERLSCSQNDENNVTNRENEGPCIDFVNRHRRNAVPFAPLNLDEEESEDENNLEEAEQNNENSEGCCLRLDTINEENEETVREIKIILNPIHNAVEQDKSMTNNSPIIILSTETNDAISENTIVNENPRSPNKSVRLSGPSKIAEKSSTFYIDDSNWKHNGNDSFTFTNISSIAKSSSVQDSEPSCSNTGDNTADISKILTMESLGLTSTTAQQLATSTPVVSSPRTRLSRKSSSNNSTKNVTVFHNSRRSITKTSQEPNVAKVVIKRLNFDKSNTSIKEMSKIVDITPITSPVKIKQKRRRIISPSPSESSKSESSNVDDKPPVAKMKKKGKENKKVMEATVLPKSPRPKRKSRPVSLREPSINRKMRRSR